MTRSDCLAQLISEQQKVMAHHRQGLAYIHIYGNRFRGSGFDGSQ